MTESLHTEILVIGWGKAGKTLAGVMGRAGRSVTLVEQSTDMVGGTCINIGCVPTKALVHQADVRREDDDPAAYFRGAVQSRDILIDKLNAANREMLESVDQVRLVVGGRAEFTGPKQVRVTGGSDELDITADAVVLNTGAVPRTIDVPGADGPRVHDSTSIQHVDPFPARLAIVGAGPVALEFASMFAQFGSDVTLLEHGARILRIEDEDVAESVRQALGDQGVRILTQAQTTAIEDAADGVRLRTGVGDVTADAVLVAVGRLPATEGLGLGTAGVEVGQRGEVVVDDLLRTSAEGVWAVGDVNGGPQQTYVSLDDHRIVTSQLNGSGRRSRADRIAVPTTIFLTPPLGRVGLSEHEAREAGKAFHVHVKAVGEIAAMPRPRTLGETHGLIKFVVDADTDEILGAALHTVDAQELVNLVALAMRTGTTAAQLRDGIWTHPSTTEALNEVLVTPGVS
ncbi:FAD-dependent oxidoreductase [Ornithinimicrobium cryptoxanthini]|uniref:FAD-dependent oxidoreductase n=1 Tax=Ornithinimicrobium cryptoxanthini TaxID=2934161 RepID=A0ABY4YL66_9MICO|nr:FAD-dependent oxidoreductase [Ornithinimicrobium cryptoxanthini]USQ77301.1 FAD-dependent oxidoreductase [Ornithinimicrobium cryptoxanthini]